MIDSVRNTVLSVLNKNNFGYISPTDFNLFAKQAQMELFREIFSEYNTLVNKENALISGEGYADVRKITEEMIDKFSVSSTTLAHVSGGEYSLPTNLYSLTGLAYTATGSTYPVTFDRVSNSRVDMLLSSSLTEPTISFPVYTKSGNTIRVYPSYITPSTYVVKARYVRYPLDPKWTYNTLSGGEPVFNISQSGYQDFELPAYYEPMLVSKILQHAGLSIRDLEIYQASAQKEIIDNQQK